jgi:trehalose synthase
MEKQRVTQGEDDRPLAGVEMIERIMKKAKRLQHLHVANVNLTYYGGGVAELLTL